MKGTQETTRPVTLWHIRVPTAKGQGNTPQQTKPEPEDGRRRVICGSRYQLNRCINREDFVAINWFWSNLAIWTCTDCECTESLTQ